MIAPRRVAAPARRLRLVPSLLAVLAAGCGRAPAVPPGHPVSGAVILDGRPFLIPGTAFGKVWFHPDPGKGNTGQAVIVGHVDEHGRYELPGGAAAGWYRVSVVVAEKVDTQNPSGRRKSLVAARYGRPETSGLAVEVGPNPAPGGYDLRLVTR